MSSTWSGGLRRSESGATMIHSEVSTGAAPPQIGLQIECHPAGRAGNAKLVARIKGEVVFVDTINLTKSAARDEFATQVRRKRPDIDIARLDAELLRLAAESNKTSDDSAKEGLQAHEEIDASRMVRPERFITEEVRGLAVPTIVQKNDRPIGRWKLYLRWRDGKRECIPIKESIDITHQARLWIHPTPGEPATGMLPGWSMDARSEWLYGSQPPRPSEVFKRLSRQIAFYVDFTSQQAQGATATLALWSLLTYCYPAWSAVPYLFIGGPTGSGKTRVFEVLSQLVFRPFASSNVTAPALFRTLHGQGGTLLFDEAEQLKQTNRPDVGEINSMLLAGYKRGGRATRLEPFGDSFKTVEFDVFGPKALACISALPSALASRCIPIIMFRSSAISTKPQRRIDKDPRGWQELRDDLHASALEHGPTWLELAEVTDVCPRMTGRNFELWQPLLSLASWVERDGADGLLALLQEHALRTIADNLDEQTPEYDETLLRLLSDEIREGGRPTATQILEKAKDFDGSTFKNWTARGVSAHLKRYGVITNKSGGRKVFGKVSLDDLRVIQSTYGVDLGLSGKDE